MDDLLIKYILKEATPEESDQVLQWLAADIANQAHFNKLQAVWQIAAQPNLSVATDTPQALQRLKQTLQARETAPVKRIRPRTWAAGAAMVGIAVVVVGAYILMKPKNNDKERPPVVQPDTVLHKPMPADTVPVVQPVPASQPDTLPFVKPHKKKLPRPVTPTQPVHRKKKAAPQPIQPADSTPVKKKHPSTPQPVQPVKKHKSATRPTAPQAV